MRDARKCHIKKGMSNEIAIESKHALIDNLSYPKIKDN